MNLRRMVLGMAFGLLSMPALAQSWPERPVTFVVPFPSGPLDVMARPLLQKLSDMWGKPTIIDNKTGATGTIGMAHVARAEPDGYTLLFTVDLPVSMAPNLLKVTYDPLKDFDVIADFAETEQMLVVNPSVGVKNFAALIAKAKAEPGKLTYSSAGIGSPGHLCTEMISQATGIKAVHVPYRGAAPAMQALVAGEVDMFCGPLTQGLPFIRSDKAVPLATSAIKRAALTPEVPTFIESGLKDFTINAQYYLMAPKALPKPLSDKIKKDFKTALDDPDTQKRFADLAIYPKWLEGPAAIEQIRRDLANWAEVIKKGGVKAE
jgi:tripartite-type tricarboxylate transporter receptor subunit TctC